MALEVLSAMPPCIVQGDTVLFTINDPAYLPSDWQMKLAMIKAGESSDPVIATDDTRGGFAFEITAQISATLSPGSYAYSLILIQNGTARRLTYQEGNFFVRPDPLQNLRPSQAQIGLAAVKNTINKLLAKTVSSATVGNETWTLQNIGGLYAIKDRLQNEVDGELRALGLGNRGGARTIVTQFHG